MEEIKISTGIKKIAIKDEEDNLITVLSVDTADAEVAEKFNDIINALNNISTTCTEEFAEWKSQNKEAADNDIETVLAANRIRVKALTGIMDEIDSLFGEGSIKNVYGDTIPDELAIVEFVEKIVPVMNELFERRYKLVRQKYNVKKRGAK